MNEKEHLNRIPEDIWRSWDRELGKIGLFELDEVEMEDLISDVEEELQAKSVNVVGK